MNISVIVPFYNEEGNLINLFTELKNSLDKLDKDYEIIFINDGSNDNGELEVNKLIKENSSVKLISLSRNFGQTAGWSAGFDNAKGDLLITIDADGQNDPADIGKMIELLQKENADIVNGWRKNRKDPFLRSLMSKAANKIVNWSMKVNIHDSGCSLRIIKKEAIKDLKLYGEMHRLLPFLLARTGNKILEIPVNHRPREIGKSKYGFSRIFKVLLDLVTIKFLASYSTKPIYMFGQVGFFFFFLSIISGGFIISRKLLLGGEWISPMLFVSTTFFTVGVLCILMGLLAEIQVRAWYESSNKKSYQLK